MVIVGTYISYTPTQCTAITNGPAPPTVTIDTTIIPATSFLHSGIKTVSKKSHGVSYTLTYGSEQTLHVLGKSAYSWGIVANFKNSPVAFRATGGGTPGSAGFNASMRILASVRATR
jgi:hypothetical protein